MNPLLQRFASPVGQGRAVSLSLLRLRSLRWSLLLILLGAALWLKREWPAGKDSEAAPPTTAAESTLAAQRAPLPFRLGAGYAGGFLLSFAFRKFLKATALLAGVLLAAVAALRALGWVDLDWQALEGGIRTGLSWTQDQALSLKAILESYLPATTASGVGLWRGWRHSGQPVTAETA